MMRVDILFDASFGPPSGRGCEDVIGTYGESLYSGNLGSKRSVHCRVYYEKGSNGVLGREFIS